MDISVFSFFWVIGVSIGTLMTGLYLVTRFSSQTNDTARQLMSEATDTVSFIYDDTVLIDASEKAYDLLRSSQIRSDDWTSVFALLSRSFPNLTDSLMDLAELGKIELTSVDKTQTMTAEWWNGLARLTLHNDESAET